MTIYEDYVNWKFENHEFIHELVQRKSKTIARFSSVIVVVDYLYDKYVKNQSLSEDEETFFSVGFDYVYDNFHLIKTLFDYKFEKDYNKLEFYAKTVNLLLYINEFQAELLNHKDINAKELDEFEQRVNEHLDKMENVPDTFFPLFDEITNRVFEQNGLDFMPIEDVFYQVALEYNLYKNNDFDMYNTVFNLQKNKK